MEISQRIEIIPKALFLSCARMVPLVLEKNRSESLDSQRGVLSSVCYGSCVDRSQSAVWCFCSNLCSLLSSVIALYPLLVMIPTRSCDHAF